MAKLRTFVAGIVLAVLFAAPAAAQTISYQQAVGELANACGADIGKYCKGINLGNGMAECMQKNEARISQTCKATIVATQASLDKRAAAQAAVPQICASDIKRLCKEYDPGNGRILRCLLKFNDKVHANCNQAITDAGWR